MARSDMTIAFTHENIPSTLAPALELCLFRIAQEALQNALKHSHARRVSVELSGKSGGIELTIVDDGVGFNPDAAWSRGLDCSVSRNGSTRSGEPSTSGPVPAPGPR